MNDLIGKTLHDVLQPSFMLDAVTTSITLESGPDSVPSLDTLTRIAERRFSRMTITAASYSPKRRQYQIAVRINGERTLSSTMHLPQRAFKAQATP